MNWQKATIGFGIITILSGLYLTFTGDYLIGISGACVGLLLIYMNKNNPTQNHG